MTRPAGALARSEVFELPEPLRFAGAWKDRDPLASRSPDSLTLREGCADVLRGIVDGMFVGSTDGNGCGSSLRGASNATSEVRIGPDRIESWDRGFDESGDQVWGAGRGPSVSLRGSPTEGPGGGK